MAGVVNVLFVQQFAAATSVELNHNLGYGNWAIQVVINGEVRNDLVDEIVPDAVDPLNTTTVNLSVASTGRIQLVSTDFTPTTYLAPAVLRSVLDGPVKYPNSAIDPVSPAPAEGDTYYNTALQMQMQYDGSRSKWLSVESATFGFGRNGNTGAGAFYRTLNGLVGNAARGYDGMFNGTVVGIAYTRSDTDPATFDVLAAGTSVGSLASSTTSGRDTTLDGDFVAGSALSLQNQAGGNTTSNVVAWVRVKWRA